ncbi:putative membrane protein [Synechococcus sp. A18-46.1]|nr:putative membrane protein [Synechococcus sp. A18-46.1]
MCGVFVAIDVGLGCSCFCFACGNVSASRFVEARAGFD